MPGGNRDRDALEMLERCHRQLEEALDGLCDAAAALADGRGGQAELDAVAEAVERLQRTGVRHVADEEQSLFPRLAGRGVDELIVILVSQHREHQQLEAELAAVAARVRLPCPADVAGALDRVATALRRAYQVHMDREDRELIPAAAGLLDEGERAALRDDMQARRGR
jgi:iron-sulfur cluster repair protein YtfE (RIC family)